MRYGLRAIAERDDAAAARHTKRRCVGSLTPDVAADRATPVVAGPFLLSHVARDERAALGVFRRRGLDGEHCQCRRGGGAGRRRGESSICHRRLFLHRWRAASLWFHVADVAGARWAAARCCDLRCDVGRCVRAEGRYEPRADRQRRRRPDRRRRSATVQRHLWQWR